MGTYCGQCGCSLPNTVLDDENWAGCPRCNETREARAVNAAILITLERIVVLLEKLANPVIEIKKNDS